MKDQHYWLFVLRGSEGDPPVLDRRFFQHDNIPNPYAGPPENRAERCEAFSVIRSVDSLHGEERNCPGGLFEFFTLVGLHFNEGFFRRL